MIEKLLIANRGEIACRIMRTCRSLGIHTVAVFSDADVQARHVQEADEAIHIGPAPAADSYLAIEKIIAAAQQTGADAIHPGFGFLAENATFAAAVGHAGLIFVGPTPHAIEAMGNKSKAKALMQESNVPLIPGYHGDDQRDEALASAANKIGFPLMIKAVAGGGGKGMRIVEDPQDFPEALAAARREGEQAFGSAEIILERALLSARHIEVQVFGDSHGNIIHLGERDCSVQRRHQKVVEEAPAVGISADLRAQIGSAAVRAAQAVNYQSAGTVEFLLDSDGAFYFLEMNTRIQVEHPVTELITGVDLVEWQIKIAEGERLPISQNELELTGHAIEVRIYAENPANNFLPVTGDIALWRPPAGAGIRVDSGLLNQGDRVSIYYDPMIAKVIARGVDRKTARRRLLRALSDTHLLGLTNNIDFLSAILKHPIFGKGEATTGFIATHLADWQPKVLAKAVGLIAATITQHQSQPQTPNSNGFWRNSPNRAQLYRYHEQPDVELWPTNDSFTVKIAGETYLVSDVSLDSATMSLTIDGHRQTVLVMAVGDEMWVSGQTGSLVLKIASLLPKPQVAVVVGSMRAPMPGEILAVLVAVGDAVAIDQPLLKLEAMKMEHTIRSNVTGIVTAIHFAAGDQVEVDAQLLVIDNDDSLSA